MPDIDRYRNNLINSEYHINQILPNIREMVKVEPAYKEFQTIESLPESIRNLKLKECQKSVLTLPDIKKMIPMVKWKHLLTHLL